jgi:DNA-binding MarR family transcriptional regulator
MADQRSVSELSDHLGYWLRLVSNRVSTSFARKLAGEHVTVAEWVVLRILFEGNGVAPNKLASLLGMTRGAISKLADRLIAKRLVQRTDSLDDGRTHSLALTSKGNRLVPRLAALADENDRHFFSVLDPSERVVCRTVLEKLASRHGLNEVPID